MSFSKPPKIAELIIRILTRPGNRSLLLGDLEEDYRYYTSEKGLIYAKLWYWMQIVIPFHNFIKNQIYWSYYMFKNYFKSAYRNLFRNKTYGTISILSLAITIGCAISLFSLVHIFYKFDKGHENRQRIFMVGTVIETNSVSEKWGIAPAPLAPAIKADLSNIEDVVRITYQDGKMQNDDRVFYENICFVDNGFLDMFTYPLVSGGKAVLSEKDAVIITENIALKYFGNEDPIGRQLTITFDNGSKASFFVKGIAENMSILKTFGFEILLNYDNLDRTGIDHVNDWSKKPRATFLMLKDPTGARDIEAQLSRYINQQNDSDPDWMAKEFFLGPFEEIIYASSNIRNSITGAIASEAFIIFSAIGLILLILACINYINVALASATRRIKEIGIRKVFGSKKNQLCIQFLSENLLVCLIALLFGIILAQTVFFPAFQYIGELNIEENIFTTIDLWYMFPGILLLTSILSGLYPALFISSYNPVAIFRDKKIRIGKNLFTKMLLGFQFVVTSILITVTIVLRLNAEYQSNLDWKYEPDNLIVLPVNGEEHYSIFKNEIGKNPDIVSVSGGSSHIGSISSSERIEYRGEKYQVRRFDVGSNYLETMGIKLKEGRFFNEERSTDIDRSVLVNEEFVKFMKWDDPFNEYFRIGSIEYSVIGVVNDFHHNNFMEKIRPMVFRLTEENNFKFLVVKTREGRMIDSFEYLRDAWKRLLPQDPYEAFYQSQLFDQYLRNEKNVSKLFGLYALVALVISSLGLFGLISINVLKKIREIGIRKVLGASTFNIVRLVNKGYLRIMLTSSIPAGILSFYLASSLMKIIHVYHLTVTVYHVFFTFVIILLTTLITISTLVRRAALTNPAETLRYE